MAKRLNKDGKTVIEYLEKMIKNIKKGKIEVDSFQVEEINQTLVTTNKGLVYTGKRTTTIHLFLDVKKLLERNKKQEDCDEWIPNNENDQYIKAMKRHDKKEKEK